MKLNQAAMAERLGITREWYSRLETGGPAVTELLQIKIEKLEKENSGHIAPRLKTGAKVGALEEPADDTYGRVASRLPQDQRKPSTRAECEAYFATLMERAEASDNPNAFPVIHDRLRKKFPLDEWEEEKKTE